MPRKKPSSGSILLGIVGLVVIAVLVAPAENNTGGGHSIFSSGPTGTRLAFDLARRLGWPTNTREVPFTEDSSPAAVQALIGVSTGAVETHALLDHVRAGGGLLVAGIEDNLADSLHLAAGASGLEARSAASDCPTRDPFENLVQGTRPIAPIRWRHPAPPDTVGFGMLESRVRGRRPAVGFPLGSGRVVVIADADFLNNDVLRVCATESDIAYVQMLDYLTHGRPGTRIAFDEFLHGRGIHGGSLSAVRTYVASTPSGRMLGQIVVAGLLLLIAAAPRPLAPREPSRVARRSPLEHAEALARAYTAVGATRTATTRLLAGVRRRTRRGRVGSRENDEQILATAAASSPNAGAAAATVSHALAESISAGELTAVATALSTIEEALTSRPSTRKS